MPGVIINTLAVFLGSFIGLALRRGIPERITQAVMTAIGLSTLYLGISGALAISQVIVAILALVLGSALGTLLDIDGAVKRLGGLVEGRMRRSEGREGPAIGEGFVTASLLFCVGSMTIVGSLNAGLSGDYGMLLAKSVLDLISSVMLSVSLGLGVMLSGVFVFLFQGALVLLAGVLKPLLSSDAVALMSGTGGLLILALGLNLLGITRIKVADMLPAILLAPIFGALAALF
ncbi:MAG: DUF554 domain-containing protein [Christensenellales bacterium]